VGNEMTRHPGLCIHLNDVAGLPFTMFTNVPTVLTIHHPHERI
jgi:hypothetical protein